MISEYKVTALKMGTLEVDKSTQTYGLGFGQEVEVPVWAAAVEGDGHRIVVDTGIADPGWVTDNVAPCTQRPDETLEGALQEIGWSLEDADIVLNTHLHYDHADNNALMPQARFYVSEREWNYARQPIDTQQTIYNGSWERAPLSYFNYSLVAVDHFDVLPGLRLIKTPGHSAGHQSVLVNTREGTLCIAGDALNLIENLTVGAPPGILVSTEEALESMKKIRGLADCVLTGHDPGIEKYQTGKFPRVK
jgi:N-acyl homoserine lactone hydrolase